MQITLTKHPRSFTHVSDRDIFILHKDKNGEKKRTRILKGSNNLQDVTQLACMLCTAGSSS